MNSELTFKQGLKDTMPTVFGYIGIGIAFGMIGHSEGFSVWVILLLSLIVYAGSACQGPSKNVGFGSLKM
ncbi:AzlC family ABC transporter permease [Lactococcus lactis subsp. lactis]|nr:AzlC family ABC transporter permease [Lactococcus lactis]USI59898.1 AzlC family ABC transporter permease [Lactococcus lactis subsp. lactis]